MCTADGHVGTQGETRVTVHAEERGLRRHSPAHTSILDLRPPGPGEDTGRSGSSYDWAASPSLEVGFWGGFKTVIGSAGKPPGLPTPARLESNTCPDPGNARDEGTGGPLALSGLPSPRPFPSLAGPSCCEPTLDPPAHLSLPHRRSQPHGGPAQDTLGKQSSSPSRRQALGQLSGEDSTVSTTCMAVTFVLLRPGPPCAWLGVCVPEGLSRTSRCRPLGPAPAVRWQVSLSQVLSNLLPPLLSPLPRVTARRTVQHETLETRRMGPTHRGHSGRPGVSWAPRVRGPVLETGGQGEGVPWPEA